MSLLPKKQVEKEEEVACPVCGKPVGLTVPSCPFCGAEFEEEAEEEPAEPEPVPVKVKEPARAAQESTWGKAAAAEAPAEEEEEVACPVCGRNVGIDVACCPFCGAEFEEEEIEEVVEVEEKEVVVEEEPEEEPEVEEAEEAGEEISASLPASIADLRVIGVSLMLLGIIGSQIALMIDWYWSWVPPIEDNIIMFAAIAAVVLVVGLLVFFLVKKMVSSGKRIPGLVPSMSLSLFIFGIFALVLILLWDPINQALVDSQMLVGGGFLAILFVGIVLIFFGTRSSARAAAD